MRLTDKKYWTESYGQVEFNDQKDHNVAVFLRRYAADGHDKKSLELGSFPGGMIPTIARKGFLVNGVDFHPGNANELPAWLRSLGLSVGQFWVADLFDFISENKKQFDLVCSFGLIEHFENYGEIIDAHIALVQPGGQLIITTPNFRGWMQLLPHWVFDSRNLKKHYLPSMNPKKWKDQLERSGFEVTYSGYFGGYGFWVDPAQPRSRFCLASLRFTQRVISQFMKLFKLIGLESSAFSQSCGIVAFKREAQAS